MTVMAVDVDGRPLVEASRYGCGSDSCLACYPYVYRCDEGHDFPAPVPNDGRVIECGVCEVAS